MRRLIVFSGPPCSGKSTLAEKLSQETKFVYLQMDRVCDRLFSGSMHGPRHREVSYRAMHFAAEQLLERNQSVILDATYRHERHRLSLQQIRDKTGAELYLIQCKVSVAEALRRFAERLDHPAIDLTEKRVARQVRDYPYSDDALIVETTQDVLSCLEQIKLYQKIIPDRGGLQIK